MLDTTGLNNGTVQAFVCGGGDYSTDVCLGICPNPDIMGIGVRLAFYIQSCVNTLLVIFSPTDSVPTTWAGTLLTTALIVAAIVLKAARQQSQLTLYHGTLILNFATLSSISSLAVAPMLPIWRLSPAEYYRHELEQHMLHPPGDEGHDANHTVVTSPFYVNIKKRELKAAQKRARIVLSLAILIQVALQWTWGIYLFVSPNYSQQECSGDTKIVMYLMSFNVSQINTYDPTVRTPGMHPAQYFVWASWILFNLLITFGLIIILAVSSSTLSAVPVSSEQSASTPNTPALTALYNVFVHCLLSVGADATRLVLIMYYVVVFVLWVAFIYTIEHQRSENAVFAGENDFKGFGQITAFLLSLAPLWTLFVGLYKYPALRRRLKNQHGLFGTQHPNLSAAELDASPGHSSLPSEEQYLLHNLSPQSDQHRLSPSMPSVVVHSAYSSETQVSQDEYPAALSFSTPHMQRRSTHWRNVSY
ncbi:hypothetical protein NM688_g5182 [Phlebia brevispora]|uniref:Uncharacterized protein n=1 Tax=Phlebia brevispora TaxID=194682 RepID=A0ACC1SZA3_9APHY|nr:hypothetical protein NM688_g5182 [Phlebia brevispora]